MKRLLMPVFEILQLAGPARVRRHGGISPQTLVLVRWIAVLGQLAAVGVVEFLLGFLLPLWECLLAILLLVVSNLYIGMAYPGRGRLTDYHAARILAFDLVQLSVLAYLTGGLQNPFSFLILVPVTVSATMLSRGATVMLTVVSLFACTFLAFYRQPLPWPGGGFTIDPLYMLGLWTALAVTIVFTAIYLWSLTEESRRIADALAETEAALARQQKLSALGGLAAAAAHELGSPLATIAVVAKELSRDVPEDSPYAEDVALLLSQSNRCRDILAGLTLRPEDHEDGEIHALHLTDMVEMAALNHVPERVALEMSVDEGSQGAEPVFLPSPEMRQGLGNLIQNAGQYATQQVDIDLFWNERRISIAIRDDGPGFAPHVLENLGNPYISTRAGDGEHMGLGVFIAQTLLERTGALVRFGNRPGGVQGAEVVIRWQRDMLEGGGLGGMEQDV